MGCKVLMGLLGFDVGSFWGEQAGFKLFWYCHRFALWHTFEIAIIKSLSRRYFADHMVVSSFPFRLFVFCILYGMVSEEQ